MSITNNAELEGIQKISNAVANFKQQMTARR